MIFIKSRDIERSIRDEHLSSITADDATIMNGAELASITEIKSYLIGKYDVSILFGLVADWNVSASYSAGTLVYYETDKTFYISTGSVSGSTPPAATEWELTNDPRDPLIVEFMVDLILYRIHSRIAPKQIPEHRMTRRDDVISFLKHAAKYTISVPWDQESDVPPASIEWGSNERESKQY
tara:strand:+ start:12059 stop:12601 length:543 start_codon:yes stop_codon:yes gene_type:complete